MKRRNFVKTLASLAAVGSLPGVASAAATRLAEPGSGSGSQGPAALTPRSAAGNFALQIDGTDVGFLESVEGGNAVAEVINEGERGKRLGALSYEPLRVTLTAPPHADVTKLINEALTGSSTRRTLTVVSYDFNMKPISSRELVNPVLSEVAVEPLNAGAKNPVSLMLAFQSEIVRTTDKVGTAGKLGTKQKAVTAFRFSVSGIDGAGVAAVELPVAKRSVSVKAPGEMKTAAAIGRFDLSNFTAEIGASQAQPWLDWFEQFAVSRKDPAERTAKLELMSADLKDVLYTISLTGVGISALRTQKVEANTDATAKLQATMYAERITYGS